MNNFPLTPFLTALAADGFGITLRDYHRISAALRAAGPWRLAQLRGVLQALLVRDSEQEAVFQRHFDSFFRTQLDAEARFGALDLDRALADLHALAQAPRSAGEAIPASRATNGPQRVVTPAREKTPHTLGFWVGVSVALLPVVAVWMSLLFIPILPKLCLSHKALDFGDVPVQDSRAKELLLTNCGAGSVEIQARWLSPPAHEGFTLTTDTCTGAVLAAEEACRIVVRFAPLAPSEQPSHAQLRLDDNTGQPPHQVMLRGSGTQAFPQPDDSASQVVCRDVHWEPPVIVHTAGRRARNLAGLLLAVLVGYSAYLWWSRRVPQDKPPIWQETGQRRFRLGDIGGKPAPRLDATVLDHLADALGYFHTDDPSTTLDVAASITATAQNGGLLSLRYHRRQALRTVLILEDAFAEAVTWNPCAQELAAGLAQRGVPVVYGRFQGSPQRVYTPDGRIMQLDDLEDQRQGYLLLICSDGKGLHPQRDRLVLENLARWPMVAWLELREPRFWDESSALPVRFGLPLYPATADGLCQAVDRFVTEHGPPADRTSDTSGWHGIPAATEAALMGYSERLLGDALPWAQACAMFQPLPLGLADAVRRRFCVGLPAERVERLFALPGTTRSDAGLRFTTPVLAVLRQGFQVRWDEEQQAAILRFFLQQLAEAQPDEAGSPAYLTWQWASERVRLELEPDAALQTLAALSHTPLGHAIRAELDASTLPDQPEAGTAYVPLRRRPHTPAGLQRLARLAAHSGIAPLEAYPIARGHRMAWGALALGCLASVVWCLWLSLSPPWATTLTTAFGMEFVRIPAGTFQMGSPVDESGRSESDSEGPQHEVRISKPFYLGKYEVTQEQWQQVVQSGNPSRFKDDPKRPVERVSWEDVQAFLQCLNAQEAGSPYRLPTEAEWEYAARAGTTTAFHYGDTLDSTQANFNGNYPYGGASTGLYLERTTAVGSYKANAFGLYDMHGNVWEWVQDWYDADYYKSSPVRDPQGPDRGVYRVLRGGSWFDFGRGARSAQRDADVPGDRDLNSGFRFARGQASSR